MIVPLDILVIIFMVISGIIALKSRDLLVSAIVLGIYSYAMATIYIQMNALDVGFTEAVVGAGISTALMVASLIKLKREDDSKTKKFKAISGAIFTVIMAFLLIYVVEYLPEFGDEYSPANKWIELFKVEKNEEIIKQLDEGKLPEEIERKIVLLFGKEFSGVENAVVIKNEHYGGWDVLIDKGEKFFPGYEKLYHISEELVVYRYSIPVRWQEKSEEEMNTPNMVTAGLADYRGYDTLGETVVIFTAAISVAAEPFISLPLVVPNRSLLNVKLVPAPTNICPASSSVMPASIPVVVPSPRCT